MTEATSLPLERPRRFHFGWVAPAFFRPRQALKRVAAHAGGAWLTPLLILTVATLARVLVTGWLQQSNPGAITFPPDFEFWTQEQQAQFMQAQAATQGPVFVYVFPAVIAVLGAWVGWLLLAAVLHLVLTLLGGRGTTRETTNLVAWASLPFAVRAVVRAAAMLATRQIILHPGLSGFAPAGASGWALYFSEVLGLVDAYLLWHLALIVVGIRVSETLPRSKALGGALASVVVVLLLQALPGFVLASFSGLTLARPFFF